MWDGLRPRAVTDGFSFGLGCQRERGKNRPMPIEIAQKESRILCKPLKWHLIPTSGHPRGPFFLACSLNIRWIRFATSKPGGRGRAQMLRAGLPGLGFASAWRLSVRKLPSRLTNFDGHFGTLPRVLLTPRLEKHASILWV